MECIISIVIDGRRKKRNNKYPVKLRVYSIQSRKARFYPINMDMSLQEFDSTWNTKKPREEFKGKRNDLMEELKRAENKAKGITPFNFDLFEEKIYRKHGDGVNVFYHYQKTINNLEKNNQFNTATVYKNTQKSILEFVKHNSDRDITFFPFSEITAQWLQDYENYMLDHLDENSKHIRRSQTTISMYLRTLRTLFISATESGEIPKEIYPFGKGKYQIPNVRNIKKALTEEQLKKLFKAKPTNEEQKKARGYWLFSYACNGMNIKDIAQFRYSDIYDDKLVFYRAKTIRTAKQDLQPTVVYLTTLSQNIIEKYGNKDKSPESYIFPIIENSMSPFERNRAIKNFTRFINQHIQKLAKTIGLPEDLTTYWARHSFSTMAIRKGASIEFVGEALSHKDPKTTLRYFAGFDDENKRNMMKKLVKL